METTTSNFIKIGNLYVPKLKLAVLTSAVRRSVSVMLIGMAGSAKTETAKAVAVELNRKFYSFNMGASESDAYGMLIGQTVLRQGKTEFIQSQFITAIETPNSVILLDEISRACFFAQNLIFSLLDTQGQVYISELSRHIELAPGVSFIATANIGREYSGTVAIDLALNDRFTKIEVETLTAEMESTLVQERTGLEKFFADQISLVSSKTRQMWKEENLANFITTRMSLALAKLYTDLQESMSLKELATEILLPIFDNFGSSSDRAGVLMLLQAHMIAKPIPGKEDVEEDGDGYSNLVFSTQEQEEILNANKKAGRS